MKTYYCNSSMKTNFECMLTRVENIAYDFEHGLNGEVYICGTSVDWTTIYDLLDELHSLYNKVMFGKVNSYEYGLVKKIQIENQNRRYVSNIRKGNKDAEYSLMV